LVLAGYPYIVVFELIDDEIVILHVNHARQQWPPDDG
jgi:plasmid stabilization system protein ParE